MNSTYYKFSLFGIGNGSSIGHYEALRGTKNIRDVGKLIKFNGASEVKKWSGDQCNEIKGSDGTSFPPFNKPQDGMWTFSTPFCRSLQTKFVERSSYNGIATSIYTTDFGDIKVIFNLT